jgi:hypothetical protein
MRKRRRKNIMCALRLDKYPNAYISNADRNSVNVSYWYEKNNGAGFVLSRRDARLLAKRINQFLDATKF